MNPLSTRVATGPNWLRVKASLFQKMLLKSATGLEKSGAPAGSDVWNTGSLASAARPAECPQGIVGGSGGVMQEFSDVPVVTLLATVLLLILALEASSSMTAPPMSAAPLFTIMLLRMLIAAVSALATKMPPPSSPEKLLWIRLRSMSTLPEPAPRHVATVPPLLGSQLDPVRTSDWIAMPAPESTASL